MWLHNPDWKVSPTISFVDGYPRVLTCKDHDGLYNLIQIHCCRWRTNIPSPLSDQVFRAIGKPLTVKHMKVGYNFTGYQIVEQQNSWKGPDTINVSSVGNTDHGYILISEIFVCERNALRHMIKQLLVSFLLQMKKKARTIPMIPTIVKILMIQMMM